MLGRDAFGKGFTIIELLIVIVVISILAAITVVAYTGIQDRAKMSVARSELRSLSKAMEVFKAEHGEYPRPLQPSTSPQVELEAVIRDAGLYEATRANKDDWNNGIFPDKRFLFCLPEGDNSRYAIVYDRPLLTDSLIDDIGKTTLYTDHTGRVFELVVTDIEALEAIPVQSGLCMLATGADTWSPEWSHWSNNIPVSWAE